MSRPSRLPARAAMLGLAFVLVACDATPTVPPTPTPTPEPTPTTTTYQLDTTVWYAGLVLTFETATAVLDERGGPVKVVLQMQNPGTDDITLDTPIRLAVGGTSFDPTRETILPSVAADSSAFATLTFNVIGQSSVDGASLQVGAPDRHQGIVPFSSASTSAVRLQPIDMSLHGTAVAGDLRLVVSHGQLRWDLPDWADELPAGSAALTVTYSVTYTGTFVGGTPFTADNVSLQLPNGSFTKPRADGHSQSIAAIGPGKTLRGLSTRFEIPVNLPGTYTLLLSNGGKLGKIRFTVPD